MIVYFEELTVMKQHGEIAECMFCECKRIDFASDKAILVFGISDFHTVLTSNIIRIE